MSRICENCGSVIPDELEFCPNCGRAENDEALRDVLSGLGLSLNSETEPEEETAPEEIPEEAELPEEPEEAPRKKKKRPDAPAKKQQQKKKSSKSRKSEPKKAKKVREDDNEDDYEYDYDEYEKKPMKKGKAAIIGVLIGLFVALLLIAGVGGFMLYRLGVFNPVSDDDLLGAVQTPVPAAATPTPVILEETEPSKEPAASVLEGAEVVPDSAVEPEDPEETKKPQDDKEDVTVEEFELLSEESVTLYSRGETSEIEYTLEPESAKSALEWTSDNTLVADVDEFGVIQARRGGTCTITGKVGKKTIKVDVTCDFEVPMTVLDMNYEDITMSYEGQTVELSIDYELSDELVKSTVWESSDPSVATVDENGLVTAVSNGTAIIQASIADYTASCIVRCVDVTGNKGYNNENSEYVINYEDVTLTRKGEYFQLTIKSILPNGDVPEFTWTSDEPGVATVDNKGIVTAVSDGVAYITTTVGEDQFRCIVRVNIS